MSLHALLSEVRACRLCAGTLDPRPVLRLSKHSRILVIGQAPGSRVHASGVPWDDRSGAHLIEWLGVDRATFDDPDCFGILPMGLCYPGRKSGGDAPPRPECAPLWHPRVLCAITRPPLRILIGAHSQRRYLGRRRKRTMTLTVQSFEEYLPDRLLPLPHPSWRVRGWMRVNPWFEAAVLPALRAEVQRAITAPNTA